MLGRPRIVIALLLALLAAALVVFLFWQRSAPPRDNQLGQLVSSFMNCLPPSTTAAKREEIRGIMDRFYEKAMRGEIHAEDVIAIENDLRTYVGAGAIPDSLLFGFMSEVGKATRRLE
jgi:hypothetical protein